jgi:UDP-N-acetyl-D-galactosamine dehydrogenase
VSHKELKAHGVDAYVEKLAPGGLYVDVKAQADAAAFRARGINVWRL